LPKKFVHEFREVNPEISLKFLPPEKMEIYNDMLQEFCQISVNISIDQHQQEPIKLPQKPQLRRGKHLLKNIVMDDPNCCSTPEITHGPRGENAFCMSCGLCVRYRFLELDYVRLKTGVYFTKKRYYAPITHFKEHLRRYMGARFTEIPQSVVDGTACVDVKDPNAYYLMKNRLKQLKVPKLYKEIFTLIYMHGGFKPQIQNNVYEQCVEEFKIIMQKFLGTREEYRRHSMPSNYMLLDILLKQNGHDPYYTFPYLKNDKCRDRVLEIYSDLKIKTCNDNKCYPSSSTVL
jgi:hypothetical protein